MLDVTRPVSGLCHTALLGLPGANSEPFEPWSETGDVRVAAGDPEFRVPGRPTTFAKRNAGIRSVTPELAHAKAIGIVKARARSSDPRVETFRYRATDRGGPAITAKVATDDGTRRARGLIKDGTLAACAHVEQCLV